MAKFCFCGQPVFGKGFCKQHTYMRPDFDSRSIMQKAMDKNKFKTKVRGLAPAKTEVPKGTAELQRWFEDRHREMTGICKNCGNRTEQGKSTYKCSIAHILPKAYFKSVSTHPLNWIELCFYGKNSCHANFDNHMIDITDLNCFDEVIEKFVAIYPNIAQDEKRRIPKALLDYVENKLK